MSIPGKLFGFIGQAIEEVAPSPASTNFGSDRWYARGMARSYEHEMRRGLNKVGQVLVGHQTTAGVP